MEACAAGSIPVSSTMEQIEYDKLKRKAVNALNYAVRSGRMVRKPCMKCGKKAQAHHDDYSKPLKVKWLCPKHHIQHHMKIYRKHYPKQS